MPQSGQYGFFTSNPFFIAHCSQYTFLHDGHLNPFGLKRPPTSCLHDEQKPFAISFHQDVINLGIYIYIG